MPKRLDDQGNNNCHHLWETNRKSRLQVARAWLQQLSTSPLSPGTLLVPPFASDSLEVVAMLTNPMIQSLEDQFLHLCHDMERKHEEEARQMKELQACAKRLQQENG